MLLHSVVLFCTVPNAGILLSDHTKYRWVDFFVILLSNTIFFQQKFDRIFKGNSICLCFFHVTSLIIRPCKVLAQKLFRACEQRNVYTASHFGEFRIIEVFCFCAAQGKNWFDVMLKRSYVNGMKSPFLIIHSAALIGILNIRPLWIQYASCEKKKTNRSW